MYRESVMLLKDSRCARRWEASENPAVMTQWQIKRGQPVLKFLKCLSHHRCCACYRLQRMRNQSRHETRQPDSNRTQCHGVMRSHSCVQVEGFLGSYMYMLSCLTLLGVPYTRSRSELVFFFLPLLEICSTELIA